MDYQDQKFILFCKNNLSDLESSKYFSTRLSLLSSTIVNLEKRPIRKLSNDLFDYLSKENVDPVINQDSINN